MILDVGPLSQAQMSEVLLAAGTILWNGPVGVFEFPAFAEGTRHWLSRRHSSAFSLAGGGDTLAALMNSISRTAFRIFRLAAVRF